MKVSSSLSEYALLLSYLIGLKLLRTGIDIVAVDVNSRNAARSSPCISSAMGGLHVAMTQGPSCVGGRGNEPRGGARSTSSQPICKKFNLSHGRPL